MSARWEERQDGRDAGQVEEAPGGCPVLVVVFAVVLFAVLYLAAQVLLWIVR